jgi:hypothetical protein
LTFHIFNLQSPNAHFDAHIPLEITSYTPDNFRGLYEDDGNDDNQDSLQQTDNSRASKRPYQELTPIFVSITDLVQTEDDLAFVRKRMKEIYAIMLSRKCKAGPADEGL